MSKKPLTNKDGEVIRPLTRAEAKQLRPIAEVDPGMLEAVENLRLKLGLSTTKPPIGARLRVAKRAMVEQDRPTGGKRVIVTYKPNVGNIDVRHDANGVVRSRPTMARAAKRPA